MKLYRYKNISELTQDVTGVGIVEAGKEIVVEEELNNPNFELISIKQKNKDK